MSRRDPFDELERLLERMSGQFGGEFESVGGADVPVDVEDRGDAFVVTADLPGYDREEIEVELREETLTVGAERDAEREESTARYVRRERSHEAVSRTVRLDEPVDSEGVSARYTNGVLTVTLPKATGGESSRTIDIE